MSTSRRRLCWRLLQLAAILVLQIQNDIRDGPGGVLASLDSLLIQEVDKAAKCAQPVAPALVILGDSTVDVGVNNHLFTPVQCNWPPYGRDFPTKKPTGRFGNGKLIADFIAERLGLPYPLAYLDPNANGTVLLQGINTGSSGSGYFDLTAEVLRVKSLSQQIEWVREWQAEVAKLVGNDTAISITAEAVFVISTGSNDWVNNYYTDPFVKLVFDTTQYKEFLLGMARLRLQDLYDLGARRIVVVSLPPLGCIPSEILIYNGHNKTCVPYMNTDSSAFNTGLQSLITYMKNTLPGNKFMYFDAYTMIEDAFVNPSKYGITQNDTAFSCCETDDMPVTGPFCNKFSTPCANPDSYLFWDAFHPTEFFNKQIADVLYDQLVQEMGF